MKLLFNVYCCWVFECVPIIIIIARTFYAFIYLYGSFQCQPYGVSRARYYAIFETNGQDSWKNSYDRLKISVYSFSSLGKIPSGHFILNHELENGFFSQRGVCIMYIVIVSS